MFDRTIVNERAGPSRIDHHYHKPSTADDLRLLREMRAEVEREFAERHALDNTIKATYARSMIDQSTLVCLRLNGRDLSFKIPDQQLLLEKTPVAVRDVVAQAVAEAIGLDVVMTAMVKP